MLAISIRLCLSDESSLCVQSPCSKAYLRDFRSQVLSLHRKACCTITEDEANSITTAISSKTASQKSHYLANAAEYYSRAKLFIEVDEDWMASGSMILKALAEERKSENTGLQVMNVIKYQKPKTKLEFNFRS